MFLWLWRMFHGRRGRHIEMVHDLAFPAPLPMAGAPPLPRYVVPTKRQVHGGLYWVTDREGAGRVTTGPRYTRRSSALRAARRLNAKAEIDAISGRFA